MTSEDEDRVAWGTMALMRELLSSDRLDLEACLRNWDEASAQLRLRIEKFVRECGGE